MKIISFNDIDGKVKMILKGDSSLLVNRKPFFIPDWSTDIRMTPCVVLRISRLGKNIGAKFAPRYYDAVALGLNIYAADMQAAGDWTRGWAFDYSLPLGQWMPLEDNPWQDLIIDMNEAVAEASQVMTLRQGDMIVINRQVASRALEPEEVIQIENNNEELLYCKIK
jgi:2-keto-4-pentenoate hydratase/2-oxohepta-3-ene-1,7-dioic acid hydratase in catechol pathway